MKKSGWSFSKVKQVELRINRYNPLRGSRHIQLPKRISDRKAVINIRNSDEYCFKYAILSKHVTNTPWEVCQYINNKELEDKYDWNCISFPVKLDEIKHFEKANSVSINVFGLTEQADVYPLKVCEEEKENHFDLLYITDLNTSHYCLITDFNKLVHSQFTKDHCKIKVCKRCFAHFNDYYDETAEEKLIAHQLECPKVQRCEFPSYDTISFKNEHRSKKVRFVIYADFETLLQPVHACDGDPETSWTSAYQHHIPYSYAYLLKDSEDQHTQLRVYRGQDAVKHFVKSMNDDIQFIDKILFGDKKLQVPKLTQKEQEDFDAATACHICKKGNFTQENCKVRNHCHIGGKYLGVAHRHCNFFYQDQHFVPCFIHNLSGYDSHFIVRELGYDTNEIKVIPNTEEKYISFSKMVKVKHAKNNVIELRFLDSYRFMQDSLSNLANNLPKPDFIETKRHFPENTELLTKKGVFCYDYMTSFDKLEERQLPPKSAFYSRLSEEEISDEDYSHAENVWKNFNIKTLGEYSDMYVKCDVLILCDAFENFRKTCLLTYNLDPAYYFTTPGLAWDAMLKYTGIQLEIIKDMDMFLMVEKGIRGGITQCIKRHSVANNKYISKDPNVPSKYLIYLDANNLYREALSRHIPYAGLKWCDDLDIDIESIPDDADEGYILEVDLEYPQTLHDDHADLPFCAETKVPPGGVHKKLLTTVEDKEKYVIHYVALKQALSHGLKLKKIHRAIQFKQKDWLKPFINLNTEKRKNACNEFEKDFYKLMSNAIYGKTMEQVRNRLDIRLVSDPKKGEKLISKPNFIDRTVYNENLVGIHMGKTKIVLNKPIYIGMSILDLSKVRMYDFYYDVLKPFYGDRVKLCYQDTDSYFLEIETVDLYEDLKLLQKHLDTSNYPKDHPLFSEENKKVLGKFKDELGGEVMKAFVGLRSKVYAIDKRDSPIKKVKGIKKSVVKNKIKFEDYVQCLYSSESTYTINNIISSKKHIVSTVFINKVTLSADDDKRYILPDKINTLPYGHYRLQEEPPSKRRKLTV
ncbi:uncharacterized protein LOC128995537 [Macrosteles quadrilineatus]|uniref:uncharacterized protein LOC128995537 n=1 Tax=Macrosteles quadrilineatus TaxID=74068 RepID=UPI0023E0D36B|nr:uncharacterized protein LOC128995537 [Macrosteles quadrilineatus]